MNDTTFTIRGAVAMDGTGAKPTRSDLIVKDGVISKFGSILKGEEEGKIVVK